MRSNSSSKEQDRLRVPELEELRPELLVLPTLHPTLLKEDELVELGERDLVLLPLPDELLLVLLFGIFCIKKRKRNVCKC